MEIIIGGPEELALVHCHTAAVVGAGENRSGISGLAPMEGGSRILASKQELMNFLMIVELQQMPIGMEWRLPSRSNTTVVPEVNYGRTCSQAFINWLPHLYRSDGVIRHLWAWICS